MEEIVNKMELDACESVNICGTLEECAPHIKTKNPYIMDLSLVQKCVYEDMDFCGEETLDSLYSMISSANKRFGNLGKKLVYVIVLPESWINENDYIYDSLISNLNMLKGMQLKPLPHTVRTYIGEMPDIAYAFTMISRNAIVSARHISIQKGKLIDEKKS